jgi:hypothetical protein
MNKLISCKNHHPHLQTVKTISNTKARPEAMWAHLAVSTAPDTGTGEEAGVDTAGNSDTVEPAVVGAASGDRDGATLFSGLEFFGADATGAGAVVAEVETTSTSSFMPAAQCPGVVQMKYIFPAVVSLMVVLPPVYDPSGLLPEHVS